MEGEPVRRAGQRRQHRDRGLPGQVRGVRSRRGAGERREIAEIGAGQQRRPRAVMRVAGKLRVEGERKTRPLAAHAGPEALLEHPGGARRGGIKRLRGPGPERHRELDIAEGDAARLEIVGGSAERRALRGGGIARGGHAPGLPGQPAERVEPVLRGPRERHHGIAGQIEQGGNARRHVPGPCGDAEDRAMAHLRPAGDHETVADERDGARRDDVAERHEGRRRHERAHPALDKPGERAEPVARRERQPPGPERAERRHGRPERALEPGDHRRLPGARGVVAAGAAPEPGEQARRARRLHRQRDHGHTALQSARVRSGTERGAPLRVETRGRAAVGRNRGEVREKAARIPAHPVQRQAHVRLQPRGNPREQGGGLGDIPGPAHQRVHAVQREGRRDIAVAQHHHRIGQRRDRWHVPPRRSRRHRTGGLQDMAVVRQAGLRHAGIVCPAGVRCVIVRLSRHDASLAVGVPRRDRVPRPGRARRRAGAAGAGRAAAGYRQDAGRAPPASAAAHTPPPSNYPPPGGVVSGRDGTLNGLKGSCACKASGIHNGA